MIACLICGETGGTCHGSVPVRLTADQLADIGLTPDKLEPGGTIVMADTTEPKARYPRQEVAEGQKHGYIGEVEVYDPPQQEPGYSNSAEAPAGGKASSGGKSKTTNVSAKDVTPEEKPIAGATGLVGGTVDHVEAPS